MELNIETKQQLEKLLAKPALVAQEHIPLLQNLIKVYPYYQPLYLLLAKASIGTENQQANLTKAAMYNNGGILHQIIHESKKLTALEDVHIVNYPTWSVNRELVIEEANNIVEPSPVKIEAEDNLEKHTQPSIENLEPLKDETITWEEQPAHISTNLAVTKQEEEPDVSQQISDAPEIENLAPLQNEIIKWEEEATISTLAEKETATNTEEEESLDSKKLDFIVPEIENLAPLPSEIIKVCEIEKIPIDDIENDEQETFEEIGEVVVPTHFTTLETEKDIQEEAIPEIEVFEEEITELPEEHISKQEIELLEEPETTDEDFTNEVEPNATDETSDDDFAVESVVESIASTDFFAFEKNFNAEIISEEDSSLHEIKPLEKSNYHTAENIVSKYDDDKLPFTFLWWLAKTRKDHEQIFKPFVSPIKAVTPTADLQQQYVEHIFHIQSPLDTSEEAAQTVSEQKAISKMLSKEDELIENFIKNEPQIKVPKPDQINNENKAKKSAEDNYDLVSETLAEIYIEQMLYHKAIDTYRKLSLKFPEKSRYFADLVQSLEKKI